MDIDSGSKWIERWVKGIFIAVPILGIAIIGAWAALIIGIANKIDGDGGVAKSLGEFAREFECAKENTCDQPPTN